MNKYDGFTIEKNINIPPHVKISQLCHFHYTFWNTSVVLIVTRTDANGHFLFERL